MSHENHRAEIALAAADTLDALTPHALAKLPALVGFDGFIDAIIRVVDRRNSMAADDYKRLATIPEFAARIGGAAGRSANLELVVLEERFGGNGPLMAGAMGMLGTPVTYVGAVGKPDEPTTIHPTFTEFAKRCAKVIPLCPPAHTDALEFTDGKLMLGKPQNVQEVTWERIRDTLGLDNLIAIVDKAATIGVVNWVMMVGVEGIWAGLRDEVFPRIKRKPNRRVVIDLADPAKRSDADIRGAMSMLASLNDTVPVTLGLNLAEAQRIDRVIGAGAFDESHNYSLGTLVRRTAERLRASLDLDTVVVHPREGAGGATANGDSAWFEGPFTRNPKLSTGAGDHFNGGFAFARAAGLPLDRALAVGCGVSGAYVRDAQSPDLPRLISFLRDLPEADH